MPANREVMEKFVGERYQKVIKYYWWASRHNKQTYKATRILCIALGAAVTLIASLSSADFISASTRWKVIFAIATPFLAAVLTVITSLSQAFHWGAAWRDMVINAEAVEKKHDLFQATDPEQRDYYKELEALNDMVIQESETFFQRILGGAKKETNQTQEPNNQQT